MPIKYGNLFAFPAHNFNFPARIAAAKLDVFVSDRGFIYPDLVKEFYQNMSLLTTKIDEIVLTSSVLNKDICLDVESFGKCLRVPYEGLVLIQGSVPDE